MRPEIALFASVSAIMSLAIFYYNLRIVRKFRENKELTATKLVIKKQIPDAFMVLSISSLFFSLASFLGAGTLIMDVKVFGYFSELGVLTMLAGLLTFMKRISDAVNEGEETELEDESDDREDKDSEEDEEDKE
ncbi:MAG: hypothetical protein ABEJ87_02325 [Candidatus Nanohalobium sp.]